MKPSNFCRSSEFVVSLLALVATASLLLSLSARSAFAIDDSEDSRSLTIAAGGRHQHHSASIHRRASPNEGSVNRRGRVSQQPPTAPTCLDCAANHTEARINRLDAIKLQILSKLRLTKPPNVTGRPRPQIPSHLRQLIDDQERMQGDTPMTIMMMTSSDQEARDDEGYEVQDDYHASTSKIIALAEKPPLDRQYTQTAGACYINIASDLKRLKIANAELRVYVGASRRSRTAHLRLFKLGPGGAKDQFEKPLQIKLGSNEREGHWHKMDLTKLMENWTSEPGTNYGFSVEAEDGVDVVTASNMEGKESFRPYVEVSVREPGSGSSGRRKRTLNIDCDESSTEEKCCRYPLIVDFEQFGWDWVIAPARYSAHYCVGACQFMFQQKSPAVANMMQMNPKGSPGPCCTPTKMSSISMLYFNERGNIIYGTLSDMVVDKCGCS